MRSNTAESRVNEWWMWEARWVLTYAVVHWMVSQAWTGKIPDDVVFPAIQMNGLDDYLALGSALRPPK